METASSNDLSFGSGSFISKQSMAKETPFLFANPMWDFIIPYSELPNTL
ncbi:hypothetical protein NNO_0062 [Hydrogenimonas sp.]|nr:hypothetical protein NNO_0062 [Hydrogenimonas sp.]